MVVLITLNAILVNIFLDIKLKTCTLMDFLINHNILSMFQHVLPAQMRNQLLASVFKIKSHKLSLQPKPISITSMDTVIQPKKTVSHVLIYMELISFSTGNKIEHHYIFNPMKH